MNELTGPDIRAFFMAMKLKQEYDRYTAEDKEVWHLLMTRQVENLKEKACPEYLQGVKDIGFVPESIPDFNKTNERLYEANGWSIEVVPGIIPARDFFELLGKRKFCSSTWLRSRSSLDYLEEPDMFHDAFGHLPMLMNADFSDFAVKLAELAREFNSGEQILRLQRIYWYSIEFGLVGAPQNLKVYGAGICSSFGETNYALSGEPMYLPFNAMEVMETEFYTDHIQDRYFVIPSIASLRAALDGVEEHLKRL